ncbi:3-hydroxyacyl-ACP dehydratase FabZ [Clostridium gasigenes]|uniref:3-hydroxyacyl-[acyl-carrier-protein] dehydratase n=1 Tax=Clostridium gasigenes TaxID=94869 RepID=A0A7X0VRA9_9CLOT|nr:3-hydroxyacyl-ACP dehydratase FabZ [Clostridium gasigenes]MBB6715199.1 3-hydroxyacyl-ACP dehydratase FabZ [Clostridium gasigenes]MBU3107278.1 3-hydroxyacyl-ACP dehydratase FabZ [Clostridium gasigenes]
MLGTKEIKEIIPHRYPMLLVDRVTEIVDGVSAKGYKNVTINEQFFQGHYPDHPVMPGVLILEALAQVGAVAILSKEENKGKLPLFAGADKVRWKKQVVPGDRLDLSVEIIKMRGPIGVGRGIATVDGVKACVAEILFAIG